MRNTHEHEINNALRNTHEHEINFGKSFIHTRAQTLKDGALKDISGLAKEVGFIYPVAVTRAVWDSCIKWGKECPAVQDEDGRTWDLLVMAVLAGKQTALVDVVKFKLECLDALGNKNEIDLQLRVHGGSGNRSSYD